MSLGCSNYLHNAIRSSYDKCNETGWAFMSEQPSVRRLLAEAVVTSTASAGGQPFTYSDPGVAKVVEKVMTIWRGGFRDDASSPMNVEVDMADQT